MLSILPAHLASSLLAATTANKSSGSILDPIAKPIASFLAAIYAVIPNYGVAILILSVVWMVIISPLTLKTTRSMLAMQKLQPQLKKLQEQHKNDKQAFAQAQMELFREHNVSPFGACLPSILPLPVFIALFRIIDGLSRSVKVNGVVQYRPRYLSSSTQMYKNIVAAHGHLNAFGVDLSKTALHHTSFGAAVPYYVLLLIMMGTQYLQTVQMMSRNQAAQQNQQMQIMKFLPLIFGLICIRFPAGVVLYYAMSNVCRIAQQSAMYRFDPKVKALVAQEVDEVEAITRDIDRGGDGKAGTTTPSPPGGGGRFRDLLAAFREQQEANRLDAAKQREIRQRAKAKPPPAVEPPKTKQPPASNRVPPGNGAPRPPAAGPNGAGETRGKPADQTNGPAGRSPAGNRQGGAGNRQGGRSNRTSKRKRQGR